MWRLLYLNMDKSRVQVAVHFLNQKFPNTGNHLKEMAVVLVSQENVDREEGNIPGALPQIIQSCS